jgi:hypothetical protein
VIGYILITLFMMSPNMTPPGVGYRAERGERIPHKKGYT